MVSVEGPTELEGTQKRVKKRFFSFDLNWL